MPEVQVYRYMVADYLNVGSTSTPEYNIMGVGFNDIDEELNTQTKETAYVNDKVKSTRIISYQSKFPFNAEMYKNVAVLEKLYDIGRNQRVGTAAEVDYVRTDIAIDASGNPITSSVSARKFRCSVNVSKFSGASAEEFKMEGTLEQIGNFVDGTFDLSTHVFTAIQAAGVIAVSSAAGATSGKTKITVTPSKAVGNSYVYHLDAVAPALPVLNADLSSWTTWDGTADITAASGQKITVAEVTSAKLCVKVGQATVVSL